MNCELIIENEIHTNARSEEELKKIFNDKLATLIIHYQENASETL